MIQFQAFNPANLQTTPLNPSQARLAPFSPETTRLLSFPTSNADASSSAPLFTSTTDANRFLANNSAGQATILSNSSVRIPTSTDLTQFTRNTLTGSETITTTQAPALQQSLASQTSSATRSMPTTASTATATAPVFNTTISPQELTTAANEGRVYIQGSDNLYNPTLRQNLAEEARGVMDRLRADGEDTRRLSTSTGEVRTGGSINPLTNNTIPDDGRGNLLTGEYVRSGDWFGVRTSDGNTNFGLQNITISGEDGQQASFDKVRYQIAEDGTTRIFVRDAESQSSGREIAADDPAYTQLTGLFSVANGKPPAPSTEASAQRHTAAAESASTTNTYQATRLSDVEPDDPRHQELTQRLAADQTALKDQQAQYEALLKSNPTQARTLARELTDRMFQASRQEVFQDPAKLSGADRAHYYAALNQWIQEDPSRINSLGRFADDVSNEAQLNAKNFAPVAKDVASTTRRDYEPDSRLNNSQNRFMAQLGIPEEARNVLRAPTHKLDGTPIPGCEQVNVNGVCFTREDNGLLHTSIPAGSIPGLDKEVRVVITRLGIPSFSIADNSPGNLRGFNPVDTNGGLELFNQIRTFIGLQPTD